MRAASYIRVSKTKDGGQSADEQRGAIEARAKADGAALVAEAVEENVSSGKSARLRKLETLVRAVEAGELSRIYLLDFSRLTREHPYHAMAPLARLLARAGGFRCVGGRRGKVSRSGHDPRRSSRGGRPFRPPHPRGRYAGHAAEERRSRFAGLRDALDAAQRRLEQAQADDVQEALGHDAWVTMLAGRKRVVDEAATTLGQAEAEAARLESLADVSTEARTHSVRALRLGTKDWGAMIHRSLIEHCLGNGAAAAEFRARALAANPYAEIALGRSVPYEVEPK